MNPKELLRLWEGTYPMASGFSEYMEIIHTLYKFRFIETKTTALPIKTDMMPVKFIATWEKGNITVHVWMDSKTNRPEWVILHKGIKTGTGDTENKLVHQLYATPGLYKD